MKGGAASKAAAQTAIPGVWTTTAHTQNTHNQPTDRHRQQQQQHMRASHTRYNMYICVCVGAAQSHHTQSEAMPPPAAVVKPVPPIPPPPPPPRWVGVCVWNETC